MPEYGEVATTLEQEAAIIQPEIESEMFLRLRVTDGTVLVTDAASFTALRLAAYKEHHEEHVGELEHRLVTANLVALPETFKIAKEATKRTYARWGVFLGLWLSFWGFLLIGGLNK